MAIYEQKIGIREWAEADRPREKLLLQGRRQLTDAELVAILIGSGNTEETSVDLSKRILASCKNDLDELGRLTVQELSRFRGIGEAKALTLISAMELGRRRKTPPGEFIKISSSKDSFLQFYPVLSDLSHEEFWILILSRANCVIGKYQISKGGLSGTVADPKVIFKMAMEHDAAAIILAHNHPSGNLRPSPEDIQITKKLVAAGKMLDLIVLDHLIVTNSSFFSFNDEGLI